MGGAPAGRPGHRAGRAAAHGWAGQGRKREAGREASALGHTGAGKCEGGAASAMQRGA